MSIDTVRFPPQQLPFNRKTKKWRKQVVDWADNRTFFNYSPVRKTVMHKKINYDLLNGIVHYNDIEALMNPERIIEKTTPNNIQHYPIINVKLDVLRGEESKRVFDYKVIVTNPNAISEREEQKKTEVYEQLQQLVSDQSSSEEEFQQNLQKMGDYFSYEWQDMREIRANQILNHYVKEYNIPLIFNKGFSDALSVGEEIYHCYIKGENLLWKK